MKKILGILAAMIALALMATPAMAHTEDDPYTTDLLAGQNMDVGDVEVWNDADNLYVKYVVDKEGWCMTETHLHVAESEENIPQTEAKGRGNGGGNPTPGQFEYTNDTHQCITEYTYEIPLDNFDVDCSEDLTIAAHAAVIKVEEGCMDIYSDNTTTFEGYTSDNSGNAVLAWVHPNWNPSLDYTFSYAEWIWESYRTLEPVNGSVVDFYKGFNIPGMYLLDSDAEMSITADNGYELYVNDNFIGSAQLNEGWRDSNLNDSYVDSHGWESVESYDISDNLTCGDNEIWIAAANEQQDGGTIGSNPGGVIYEAEVCYEAVINEETAWGNGSDFDGANWATYFDYKVQCVCPSIASSSGVIISEQPLSDVTKRATTNDKPQVFAEYAGWNHGGFTMDINSTNGTNVPDGYTVEDGKPVCSYYVHFDDGVYDDWSRAEGSITFSAPVMGLIVAGTTNSNDIFNQNDIYTMYDVDNILGNDGTTYPVEDAARGLEIFYADPTDSDNQDPVSISGDAVNFDLNALGKHDSFRIILPAK